MTATSQPARENRRSQKDLHSTIYALCRVDYAAVCALHKAAKYSSATVDPQSNDFGNVENVAARVALQHSRIVDIDGNLSEDVHAVVLRVVRFDGPILEIIDPSKSSAPVPEPVA